MPNALVEGHSIDPLRDHHAFECLDCRLEQRAQRLRLLASKLCERLTVPPGLDDAFNQAYHTERFARFSSGLYCTAASTVQVAPKRDEPSSSRSEKR